MERQLVLVLVVTSLWSTTARVPTSQVDIAPLHYIANVSYAAGHENKNPTGFSSLFSPRMDFDQWKPLTGRGDPLRNDPTYDYEPPVLERVHYWADETRYEREHYPERKSEVLMLGVSSRRPSIASRPSLPPPRRPHRPPSPAPPKYDEYVYKHNDRYPMTILVPPPPPPPGHKPTLFALEDKPPLPTSQIKFTDSPSLSTREVTVLPDQITSSYALQEANLIYQSSSTNQNWVIDTNQNKSYHNNPVSSDYAGWGPTTPLDESEANDTHNFIFKDQNDYMNHPYLFYKPMLSEAPPPPGGTAGPFNAPNSNPNNNPTFVPAMVPPTPALLLLPTTTELTEQTSQTPDHTSSIDSNTEVYDFEEETVTEKQTVPTTSTYTLPKIEGNLFDMMSSMLSMPLGNGPERPEDNLYAHASDNLHVFKEKPTENVDIETMQTMLPPPPSTLPETSTASNKRPFHVNAPGGPTHDPYFHLRHTTPKPSASTAMATTESMNLPSYLIIQGHSKVKTYSSKPKVLKNNSQGSDTPKPNETNEVKHLHPIKHMKKTENPTLNRLGRVKNLQVLVDHGLGSIEIQETDVGIKYDVSDGSEVPVEVYRKGIVESDENSYSSTRKEKRKKRQISLEDLVPFDEDTLEEYVYNFLDSKRNSTGITGLIAQAVTGNATSIIDALEDDDDEEDDR